MYSLPRALGLAWERRLFMAWREVTWATSSRLGGTQQVCYHLQLGGGGGGGGGREGEGRKG